MKILLRTMVEGSVSEVFACFDQDLLLALTPPGMRVEILKNAQPPLPGTGISLNVTMLGILKQHWENDFTAYEVAQDASFFVDEGRVMPWPIKQWRHKHLVRKHAHQAQIVDDVEFGCGNFLLDALIYPFVWLQFAYRQPVYRRFFKRKFGK